MGKVCDIEQLLKTYLVAQGFNASKVFLQEFPVDGGTDGMFLIRRQGSGNLPKNIEIDVPIVRVWARDSDPHTAFLNQKAVGDLIHGLNSTFVGSTRFLHGELVNGPDRDDDVEGDVPQWVASYSIRVRVP